MKRFGEVLGMLSIVFMMVVGTSYEGPFWKLTLITGMIILVGSAGLFFAGCIVESAKRREEAEYRHFSQNGKGWRQLQKERG